MSTSNWLTDVELQGEHVRLQPLQPSHRDGILQAASDGELWNLWFTGVPSEGKLDAYINFALTDKSNGNALPYVVIHNQTGQVIGSTRFCQIKAPHRRAEIGYTWYAFSHQRSVVNTECKYLLLSHAFENHEAIAIAFQTHWQNHNSRQAILRLGAKLDGVLRNHRIEPDGVFRDTAVYSIVRDEWPAVKNALEFKLR